MNLDIKGRLDGVNECSICHGPFDVREPRAVIEMKGNSESHCFPCFLQLCDEMAAFRTEFANLLTHWEATGR